MGMWKVVIVVMGSYIYVCNSSCSIGSSTVWVGVI